MTDYKTRFQTILRELFQFDAADLDFGIYRILNYKRDQINKFVEEDIGKTVDEAFVRYRDERMDNLSRLFEEAKQKVIQTLNKDVFLPSGDLKEEYKNFEVAKDYLAIKTRKDEADVVDEVKLLVFNDLYNFFSRYYDEGDFAPQYRYSIKGHKYAIPYNGEEVKLYWANSDQYYIKTGILFRDYAFFADAAKTYKIILRTVAAREELGSNKATKARFFVLDDEKSLELERYTLVIRLQYRELTAAEVKRYEAGGGSNTAKQEKINQQVMDVVLEGLDNPNLKAALGIYYGNEKPLLLYQLSRFTAKNSRDFFIHKNLKKFLSEQLDYFIKAEVISIETLERERFLDKHITRAKVVREIGERIIDFLAQIEDFQKKLWEKKKFVLKTEYVITANRVHEEFHQEILKNKKQASEWKDLGFGAAPSKAEFKEKKLPVDTKHFSEDFKERLLEKLTETADLDDLLDGMMIKSENWQGLNLLLPKYQEGVKCVYIDPPYNTSASEILYKNDYKHSSWLCLLENRLRVGHSLLCIDGTLCITIDDAESHRLKLLLEYVFDQDSIIGSVAIRNNPSGRATPKGISIAHEYAIFCKGVGSARIGRLSHTEQQISRYCEQDEKGRYEWVNFRKHGGANAYRIARPAMFYPIFVSSSGIKIPEMQWNGAKREWELKESPKSGETVILPIRIDGENRYEMTWKLGVETARKQIEELCFRADQNGEIGVYRKSRLRKEGTLPRTWWDNKLYSATEYGTNLLTDIMAQANTFPFPKSVHASKDCLKVCDIGEDGIALDFFAGSGTTAHAVMNLNNEDGGKRKFILIEMADYFDTVMIPRIKKVAYSFNWKDGKPKDSIGNGIFFKYQALEQYEDTLDNLELKENKEALNLFGSDYLLKYFLDFESRDNAALVNFEHFKKPFSYKLKVNFEEVGEPEEIIVDLPETFHYLIGLKVKKIRVRRDKSRKYLFSLGEKEGRDIAVVWREYDDKWTKTDFKRDKDFIIQEIENWAPQVVYVNGQSALTPKIGSHTSEIRAIEPEFRKRMMTAS